MKIEFTLYCGTAEEFGICERALRKRRNGTIVTRYRNENGAAFNPRFSGVQIAIGRVLLAHLQNPKSICIGVACEEIMEGDQKKQSHVVAVVERGMLPIHVCSDVTNVTEPIERQKKLAHTVRKALADFFQARKRLARRDRNGART